MTPLSSSPIAIIINIKIVMVAGLEKPLIASSGVVKPVITKATIIKKAILSMSRISVTNNKTEMAKIKKTKAIDTVILGWLMV